MKTEIPISLQKILPKIFIIFIINSAIFAQDKNTNFPSFNSLRTPTSPAFTVLGVEPVSIERPNNPSSLAFSVLNLSRDFKSLANDFALEISPYWLMGSPTLTWREDAKRNFIESISRTFTVSIATAEIGGELFPVTGLSAGIRTSLLSGSLNNNARKNLELMEIVLTKEAIIFSRFREKRSKEIDEEFKKHLKENENDWKKTEELTFEYNSAISGLNQLILNDSEYQDSIESVRKKVQEFAVFRDGFFLDLSIAGAWNFDNGIVEKGTFNRVGIWLTPSFVSQSFSVSALLRYFYYKLVNDNLDYGARLIFTKNKYAISGEVVGRSSIKSSASGTEIRSTLIFDYEIFKGTWLNISFGKNFNSSIEKSLITSAGVNFNFNSQRFSFE